MSGDVRCDFVDDKDADRGCKKVKSLFLSLFIVYLDSKIHGRRSVLSSFWQSVICFIQNLRKSSPFFRSTAFEMLLFGAMKSPSPVL